MAGAGLMARGWEPAAMPNAAWDTPGNLLLITMVIFLMKMLLFFSFYEKRFPSWAFLHTWSTRQIVHQSFVGSSIREEAHKK